MKTNTALLKTLRGDILSFIYAVAPTKVKESTITQAYCEYYKYRDILRATYYLADKGLLKKIEMASPIYAGRKESFYQISAEGMSIVEGTASDSGVEIIREAE